MLLTVAQVLTAAFALYFIKRHFAPKTAFDNIPGPQGVSWLKGCFTQVFGSHALKFHQDILDKYGSVVKLPMLFGSEELYVSDPLALHHVIIKDQYIYEETSMFITSNALIFGPSLLSTLGDHHRRQRKMLNPVFSLKHMRDLLPVFYPIAYDLRDTLSEQVRDGDKEIDLLYWLSRAALEYIGQAGFGYAFNALHDEEANKLGSYVERILPMLFKTTFYRKFLPFAVKIGPPEFRRKVLESIPSKNVQESFEIVDGLNSHARAIYNVKKEALEGGNENTSKKTGMDKDILSILLKANMAADKDDRLPDDEVIGQLGTFILAGQDTTSHALSRALDLLCLNPDVQSRLRDEIVLARKERGQTGFDYDTLMALPYLDAVCRETLRVFPPVASVLRTTRKDVVMPLLWPILGADGKTEITEIPVKKNTNIVVSLIGANRSKKVWGEDAEEWKPERWLKPLPKSVSEAHMPGVYSSMMTFLGGGRACIGFKFAEMEMKLVLALLLETFEFRSGPEIDWETDAIARPVLKHSADRISQLPLKVSLVAGKV